MTYSSYRNDPLLHSAASRYMEMYGGTFARADSGDFLIYRDRTGDAYIPLDNFTIPLLTKRLTQAMKHKFRIDPLTLLWLPIDEDELQDIPRFCQNVTQAAGIIL